MSTTRPFAAFVALTLSVAAFTQAPADVLVARIRKETAIKFTHSVKHMKTKGSYAVLVLLVKPKDQATDNAKVLGLLRKKAGKWTVTDYVLGTATHTWVHQMRVGHKDFPASLFPKKV
jgi:hypothetical protein